MSESIAEIAEPFGPPILGAEPVAASAGDTPTFPLGVGPARVAVLEHPDPACRQRVFVGLMRDGAEHAYEIADPGPQSLVASLCARYTGGAGGPVGRTRFVEDAKTFSCTAYFDVPEGLDPELLAKRLERILRGEVAGFYGEVLRQNGFHSAHGAFELLWRAAGSPPVTICRGRPTLYPALTGGWEK